MDDYFLDLALITDPIECELLVPGEICNYCVFRGTRDCHLGLKDSV